MSACRKPLYTSNCVCSCSRLWSNLSRLRSSSTNSSRAVSTPPRPWLYSSLRMRTRSSKPGSAFTSAFTNVNTRVCNSSGLRGAMRAWAATWAALAAACAAAAEGDMTMLALWLRLRVGMSCIAMGLPTVVAVAVVALLLPKYPPPGGVSMSTSMRYFLLAPNRSCARPRSTTAVWPSGLSHTMTDSRSMMRMREASEAAIRLTEMHSMARALVVTMLSPYSLFMKLLRHVRMPWRTPSAGAGSSCTRSERSESMPESSTNWIIQDFPEDRSTMVSDWNCAAVIGLPGMPGVLSAAFSSVAQYSAEFVFGPWFFCANWSMQMVFHLADEGMERMRSRCSALMHFSSMNASH